MIEVTSEILGVRELVCIYIDKIVYIADYARTKQRRISACYWRKLGES